MREKRRSARLLPRNDVIGRIKATVPARIVDISLLGAQIEIPSALRPSVECDISLPGPDGEDFRVRTRILRCRVGGLSKSRSSGAPVLYRAGIEFAPMNSHKLALLKEFLEAIRRDGVAAGSGAVLEFNPEQNSAS